ncbi:hypothetical protein LEP1GSC175_3660 [Leptospira santarosai str. HAI821]|nr:hypothetical protein LEP1GSC039_3797 [Leptospira santarosai str. 2000027870]EMO33372.1 hypothetical protein LEP1GSC175_3660 [Leptospira santarosai str. HAI821]EMO73292.1 hypothetical protein LEP1GSC130_2193 [Leptospira santarosai str. 200403458]EMO86754.1 hypothetical protein LEP1GSC070_3762 [Leptospira santarosai str. AIM]EMO97369.1 hypothetical protein LEP1GSC120_0605 [Leptospira santarosai str. 200702252]EMP82112.1 hypothetical protein LEP1GSC162_1680 [Leptospira santarosai str. CBC1531]
MEKLHPFKDRFENAIEIPKNMPQTFCSISKRSIKTENTVRKSKSLKKRTCEPRIMMIY